MLVPSKGGGGVYQSKAHIDSVLSQQLQKADPSLFSGSEPLKLFWYVQGPSEGRRGGGVKMLNTYASFASNVSKEIVFRSNGTE